LFIFYLFLKIILLKKFLKEFPKNKKNKTNMENYKTMFENPDEIEVIRDSHSAFEKLDEQLNQHYCRGNMMVLNISKFLSDVDDQGFYIFIQLYYINKEDKVVNLLKIKQAIDLKDFMKLDEDLNLFFTNKGISRILSQNDEFISYVFRYTGADGATSSYSVVGSSFPPPGSAK
jgi:hypothetical protein